MNGPDATVYTHPCGCAWHRATAAPQARCPAAPHPVPRCLAAVAADHAAAWAMLRDAAMLGESYNRATTPDQLPADVVAAVEVFAAATWRRLNFCPCPEGIPDVTDDQLSAARHLVGPQRHASEGRRGPRPAVPLPDVPDRHTVVLRYHTGLDELGRRSFLAFRVADNIGPGKNETGVGGQAYGHVRPGEFAAREAQRGMRVVTEDGDTVEPEGSS